jgi:hypothetical protein
MNISAAAIPLNDNGGRRLGFERRAFLYTTHIPERRVNGERRLPADRRNLTDRRYLSDRRELNAGLSSLKTLVGLECRRQKPERRSSMERRAAFAAVFAPA